MKKEANKNKIESVAVWLIIENGKNASKVALQKRSEKDGKKVRHTGSERMFNDFRLLHEKYGVQIFYNQADTLGLHSEDIEFLRRV